MIGPGKVLDTNRFYIICVSAFSNLDASDAVKSTGPASSNPATGQPYGAAFPKLTMNDLVHAQNAILASLDVTRLALTIGPSMGATQVLTRACQMPASMDAGVAILPFCGGDVLAELTIRFWAQTLAHTNVE